MAPRLPLPTSPALPVASLLPREHTPFTLVYASHGRWPLPPDAAPSQPPTAPPRRLRVCVLESSWNPPHLAHIALAQHRPDADAHLLALTIGHPDKGRIDERVAAVRVEMMRAAALDLVRRAASEGGNKSLGNVAVAVTEAPTFTEKSRLLRGELDALVQAHSGRGEDEVRLTFPVGWDTVLRIFAPRYYQPPAPSLPSQMQSLLGDDDSSLVCARRGDVSPEDEADFLASDEVRKWAQQGKVDVLDLPDEAQDVSSTRVRQAVQDGRWDDVARDVPFEEVVEVIKREGLYRD